MEKHEEVINGASIRLDPRTILIHSISEGFTYPATRRDAAAQRATVEGGQDLGAPHGYARNS
jgi:hypothetical protein